MSPLAVPETNDENATNPPTSFPKRAMLNSSRGLRDIGAQRDPNITPPF
jgi:hypothetical protein